LFSPTAVAFATYLRDELKLPDEEAEKIEKFNLDID